MFGTDAMMLPVGQDWKREMLTVYDNGTRPVAQFSRGGTGLTVSFILFENLSGKPSARGIVSAIGPQQQTEADLPNPT